MLFNRFYIKRYTKKQREEFKQMTEELEKQLKPGPIMEVLKDGKTIRWEKTRNNKTN